MADTNSFYKQSTDKPLFPDLLWSKPENKRLAGKLLIIGGNQHEFAAPATAYDEAVKTGIGSAKVLLPDKLKKTVGSILENGEFAPSTKSGSFAKTALAEWLDWAKWADGILIAGDLGRNSETAITLEAFLQKTNKQVTITKDALEYFNHQPEKLLERENTVVVASLAQLQKLVAGSGWQEPIKFSMTINQLAEALYKLSKQYPASIIVKHNDVMFVAVNGQISATKDNEEIWRVKTSAHAAVWWLQNPGQVFKALTSSVVY